MAAVPAHKLTDSPFTQSDGRRWHNHLPAWIPQDPRYARLSQGVRLTLQAIADACDPADGQGNLRTAYEGQKLYARAGCSRATFRRHADQLEQLGFVVYVGRLVGGANQWAVPGAPGSLDEQKRHRSRRARRVDPDGRVRYRRLKPGEQREFPSIPACEQPAGNSQPELRRAGGGVSDCAYPCIKLSQGVYQNEPLPSPLPSPKNHHARAPRGRLDAGSRPRPRKQPKLPNVELADLAETGRLLAMHAQAVNRRIIDGSEATRLLFVAAACRSLRLADNPAAMFADMVNRQRWLLAQTDEEAARRRLNDHLYGPTRTQEPASATRRRTRPGGSALSQDARLVAAARQVAAQRGYRGDVYELLRRDGMTLAAYERALEELDQSRSPDRWRSPDRSGSADPPGTPSGKES